MIITEKSNVAFMVNPHGKLFVLDRNYTKGGNTGRRTKFYKGITSYLGKGSGQIGPCVVTEHYIYNHLEEVTREIAQQMNQLPIH